MQAEQQALAGAHRQQMQVVKWALGALSDYNGNLASSWKKMLVGKRLGTRSKRPDYSSSQRMLVSLPPPRAKLPQTGSRLLWQQRIGLWWSSGEWGAGDKICQTTLMTRSSGRGGAAVEQDSWSDVI